MAKNVEREEKLRTVAIAAVLLETSSCQVLELSANRNLGSNWVRDHRRILIGRRNLFRAKSRRSTTR